MEGYKIELAVPLVDMLYTFKTQVQQKPDGVGRNIFYVSDVDQMYELALSEGLQPEFSPRDAPWGERYFHIRDPAGNELSFAKRLPQHPRWK